MVTVRHTSSLNTVHPIGQREISCDCHSYSAIGKLIVVCFSAFSTYVNNSTLDFDTAINCGSGNAFEDRELDSYVNK